VVQSASPAYVEDVETNPESESSETRTAKQYFQEYQGKVMVVTRAEGQALNSRDFFLVESVGTLANGLLVTGLFDHSRRERLRSHSIRLATADELATRHG
jgi:hypothetical protein